MRILHLGTLQFNHNDHQLQFLNSLAHHPTSCRQQLAWTEDMLCQVHKIGSHDDGSIIQHYRSPESLKGFSQPQCFIATRIAYPAKSWILAAAQ